MKISVIIVNYNVCYFLEQCLSSVRKACQGVDAEVIVVDNNSVDGSVVMVEEKFPEVILIANKQNTGFSYANNQAIKISKGEYVLLLNPDTVVEENTFKSVIEFMDANPKAGGLGVKMIDGKGNFLPESKRGLPTPEVAFYKIFGLSLIFPKSKRFGRYHLGYLDNDSVHEIEILSGAFMLMRKSVIDEVGMLDEAFFMYGEDIDLSYRITQAGYKNYYFPKTRIIHYKGESTKKSSINYVFVFYRAMIIFARKHFSHQNANLFSIFINMAIYLRAAVAIASRFVQRMLLPIADGVLIFAGMWFIKQWWEQYVKYPDGGEYPWELMFVSIPIYIFVWLLSILFSGGYDHPVRLNKIVRGILVGTGIVLVIYSLLPDQWRFSRAIVLLGSVWAMLSVNLFRYFLHALNITGFELNKVSDKRFLIIGSKSECQRVAHLLEKTSVMPSYIAYLSAAEHNSEPRFFSGTLSQLNESVMIHKIDEIIFCARDVSAKSIIDMMEQLVDTDVDYKIAPPESLYLIGSNSIESSGDLYVIDINSISRPGNKRNKRVFDVATALGFLIAFPVLMFKVKYPSGFLKNILAVVSGKRSWVGYARLTQDAPVLSKPLPPIRKGVLNPADEEKIAPHTPQLLSKLNLIYSKDYSPVRDWQILKAAFQELGRA
jgi:O-antigen biosynthesis protein